MSELLRAAVDGLGEGVLRAVAKGLAMLNVVALCGLLKHVWPDCPPSGYAVAALTGALLGVAEVELGGRLLGRRGLLFDLSEGGWGLAIAVFAVVYALALGLFAYEWHDQRVSDAQRVERQAEQDRYQAQIKALSHVSIPPRPHPRQP